MKETIILSTNWGYNYWEQNKPGKFPGTTINERVPNWKEIKQFCPLPSIGYYYDKFSTEKFDYIIIKDITADETGIPYFDYEFVSKSYTESDLLDIKINKANRKFYFPVEINDLVSSLKDLKQSPPEKWLALIQQEITSYNWQDYIGSYFLDIKVKDLSSDAFEDRVASLLTSLGFEVLQKGHKIKGTYPDGIAIYGGDVALVYDCKNSNNYFPTAEHLRAIMQYYTDERRVYGKDKEMFPSFISKTFSSLQHNTCHLIPVDALLYLLFKKLKLGSKFRLDPIRNIFINKKVFSIDSIDNEWFF